MLLQNWICRPFFMCKCNFGNNQTCYQNEFAFQTEFGVPQRENQT